MLTRALAALVVVAPAAAAADPWQAQTAAGVEYDTNVKRLEGDARIQAPVFHPSATLERRGGELRKVRWVLRLTGEAKAPLGGAGGMGDVTDEDVGALAADVTAGRRARAQLVVAARVSHDERWPLAGRTAARAFAASSADVTVAVDDERGRRGTVGLGARRFDYKPAPAFDWTAPALAFTLEDPLWRDDDDDGAIDLLVGYRLERRTYRGLAYRNGCTAMDTFGTHCYVPDTQPRRDLVHIAAARATYTGTRVASLAYEVSVEDSTSFGHSRVSQRLTASVTTPLPARVVATATVSGQLDHYPDPFLIARETLDLAIADESRSRVALRLARNLTGAWQLEARGAFQFNAFGAPYYRRQAVYAGIRWER